MTHALTLCDHCHRHVRASERACPFCTAARPAAPSRLSAVAVVGAALVGLASDAAAQPLPPRLTIEHGGGAQGYGGPPYHPFPGLDPVERPAPPAVAPAEATVTVAVSGADPRTAAALRSAVRRSLDAVRACRPQRLTVPAREERRSVVVGWGTSSPLPREPFARCIAEAVRAALPAVRAGQRARVVVQVRYARAGVGQGAPGDRCAGFTPPGCRRTGCPGGMVCDTRAQCVPSSCGCDPATGQQVCTSDCGGGVCVPAGMPRAPR